MPREKKVWIDAAGREWRYGDQRDDGYVFISFTAQTDRPLFMSPERWETRQERMREWKAASPRHKAQSAAYRREWSKRPEAREKLRSYARRRDKAERQQLPDSYVAKKFSVTAAAMTPQLLEAARLCLRIRQRLSKNQKNVKA